MPRRLAGTSLYAAGAGRSLYFNGSNAGVSVADNATLQLTGAHTMAAFVCWNGIHGSEIGVISKTKYNIIVTGQVKVRNEFARGAGGSAQLVSTAFLPANRCVNVAGTYDLANQRLYMDGV